MAVKRLTCLERKLLQNCDLIKIFKDTISKYVDKGYIRKLDDTEINRIDGEIWYLPIFAVYNKNKPGKTCVVCDTAAKAYGLSINSINTF